MSSKGKKPAGKPQRSAIADVVAREYTIHMHKRVGLLGASDGHPPGCSSFRSEEEMADTGRPVTWRYLQEARSSCGQGDPRLRCQGDGEHLFHSQGLRPDGVTVWRRQERTYSSSVYQGTSDVRLDPQLNKKVWECGIKGVPYRLRVRISRRRNDEEGAKEKLYSYVQAVNVKNPRGLPTVVVEE